MIIDNRLMLSTVQFDTLDIGDVFTHEDDIYMVTNTVHTTENIYIDMGNAVALDSGSICYFNSYDEVTEVKATLILENL